MAVENDPADEWPLLLLLLWLLLLFGGIGEDPADEVEVLVIPPNCDELDALHAVESNFLILEVVMLLVVPLEASGP